MKRFRGAGALLAGVLMCCAGAAHAEVQKFLNPCPGQKLCPSFRLIMTPPDGWVLDAHATKEYDVQMIVPKGKTFANAEPVIYVQVFYHRDKQQTLADFARVSNERWLAENENAKISPLPPLVRDNGKEGFLRFAFANPKIPQQAFEVGALGIDDDQDGNQFVLDVVMSASSKKALDSAEKDYVGFLKAH
jgi:hypothetical protein